MLDVRAGPPHPAQIRVLRDQTIKMTTSQFLREHKGHRVAKNSIRLRAKTEEGKCPTDVISWQDSPPQEPVRSFPAARFLRRPRPGPTGSMCTTISRRRGGREET